MGTSTPLCFVSEWVPDSIGGAGRDSVESVESATTPRATPATVVSDPGDGALSGSLVSGEALSVGDGAAWTQAPLATASATTVSPAQTAAEVEAARRRVLAAVVTRAVGFGHDPAGYYVLHQLLGRGAFAQVWKAVDKASGTPLAVKIYSKPKDPTLRKLIDTEIR